jgi:hypothetical protein
MLCSTPPSTPIKCFEICKQRLLEEGRFETNSMFYRKLYLWLSSLFVAALYFTLICPSFTAHIIGAVFMAAFWQQVRALLLPKQTPAVNNKLFMCKFFGVFCSFYIFFFRWRFWGMILGTTLFHMTGIRTITLVSLWETSSRVLGLVGGKGRTMFTTSAVTALSTILIFNMPLFLR